MQNWRTFAIVGLVIALLGTTSASATSRLIATSAGFTFSVLPTPATSLVEGRIVRSAPGLGLLCAACQRGDGAAVLVED